MRGRVRGRERGRVRVRERERGRVRVRGGSWEQCTHTKLMTIDSHKSLIVIELRERERERTDN